MKALAVVLVVWGSVFLACWALFAAFGDFLGSLPKTIEVLIFLAVYAAGGYLAMLGLHRLAPSITSRDSDQSS